MIIITFSSHCYHHQHNHLYCHHCHPNQPCCRQWMSSLSSPSSSTTTSSSVAGCRKNHHAETKTLQVRARTIVVTFHLHQAPNIAHKASDLGKFWKKGTHDFGGSEAEPLCLAGWPWPHQHHASSSVGQCLVLRAWSAQRLAYMSRKWEGQHAYIGHWVLPDVTFRFVP